MKPVSTLALAAGLMIAGASFADAATRSTSTTGPRGYTAGKTTTGSCSGGRCTSNSVATGPRGNSASRSGSTSCSGGTCSGTATYTGPARQHGQALAQHQLLSPRKSSASAGIEAEVTTCHEKLRNSIRPKDKNDEICRNVFSPTYFRRPPCNDAVVFSVSPGDSAGPSSLSPMYQSRTRRRCRPAVATSRSSAPAVQPGGGRIVRCLAANQDKISTDCRDGMMKARAALGM